ncbi:hypothetical protein [Coleofasciculus sp. E1-EBD-02]|uniref:hypothetical protein n=1 Tax=Coleofasciculus sp. E1-EBD-02 TaxID=3068481 RepID=UPI0033019EC5
MGNFSRHLGRGGWVSGVGCRVSGVGCRVSGVGCRVSGVGCGVWENHTTALRRDN